jgi:predicted transcriptional regulator
MYSVDPFDGEVYWSELDKSEFTYYLQQREYGYTQRVCPVLERANSAILYYCVDKNIMKLRHLYSKICIDNNTPQRVEFSALDKLIYTYIKTRYDFCIALEEDYMETQQDIASALGVDVKTVSRFMKKMKTHGFIDYSTNNVGNRVLYKFIMDLV